MVNTATKAVPQGGQFGPEGKNNRTNECPEQAAPRVEARSLRGTFAKSICSANGMATLRDRTACDDGVPCEKLSQCMKEADATIRYLELRKKLEGA